MFLLSASRLADKSASSSYTFCYNFRRGCVEVGPVSVWLKRWARVLLSIVIGTGCGVSVGTRWACPHVVRHKSPERNAQALHHTTYCTCASLRNRGLLVKALKLANPQRSRGPWTILCDNESFLGADASTEALKKVRVTLWCVPTRSPDLNLVEKYWSWVRRQMRAMDLADLSAKRPAAGRAEYKRRFSRLVKSAKGKRVAGNVFCSLLKTCRKVVANGGRASGD